MILTRDVLIEKIKMGEIKVEPFDKRSIGPASIDLTLGNKIRVFVDDNVLILNENIDYKKITKVVDISKGYLLKPGELVLGITKEKITLPGNICGWLNSRSRFARIGLMSHITAPFIAPGVNNRQVLEVFNSGKQAIKLIPGIKICQIVLEMCAGNAKYKGKFRNQEI
ncbi:MAG: dCTP deaminase [Nanoarchaeota archaeon]|nr:dCTP deaminase [Nanoarchaeota archaeon]